MGGTTSGWSLYLKDSIPVFCYNFSGVEYTYIRGNDKLSTGTRVIRFEFQKTGKEPMGAGGTGRIFVDDKPVAEGHIARTCPVVYSADETFDVGWDKGTPVSEEYEPIARFTGRVIRVDFDLKPDFHPDAKDPEKRAEPAFAHAMLRQ